MHLTFFGRRPDGTYGPDAINAIYERQLRNFLKNFNSVFFFFFIECGQESSVRGEQVPTGVHAMRVDVAAGSDSAWNGGGLSQGHGQ